MENIRDEKGRILPGHTLNPQGRPKKKSFADYFSETEIEDLIIRIKQEIKGETKTDIVKMTVEHIFGKPKQPLVGGDEGDNPISITGINYILPNGNNSTAGPKTALSIPSVEQSQD